MQVEVTPTSTIGKRGRRGARTTYRAKVLAALRDPANTGKTIVFTPSASDSDDAKWFENDGMVKFRRMVMTVLHAERKNTNLTLTGETRTSDGIVSVAVSIEFPTSSQSLFNNGTDSHAV